MFQRNALALLVSPVMAVTLAAALIAAPPAGDASSARLTTYESSTGDVYFALSLPPLTNLPAAADHDILVLFGTSASQTGVYRDDALTALRTLLGQLGDADRVKLMAVDLDAIPMTDQFVSPRSEGMQAGLAKLDGRVPLGSTDMGKALRKAADAFSGAPLRPRRVIYIGDGRSQANLMQANAFGAAVQELADKRISVSSFAIGPNRDLQLLAALANHTGGMLYLDSNEGAWAERAGHAMTEVIRAPVAWPTASDLPDAFCEVYPRTLQIGRAHV